MKKHNSNYTFSRIPSVVRPRSVFDRSRTYKTAFDSGYLIPFYIDEILPGDTIASLSVTAFSRLSTPIVPFMDNLWMDFHFFFVPNRLVWSNWVRFCGEQDNPDDSTDYLLPQVDINAKVGVGSIYDYLGVPSGKKGFRINALPLRAINLIWNTFYRDENLQDSVAVPMGDGPDSMATYTLLKRGKRKSNQFASALPWPQKGPGVEMQIGGSAPVYGDGNTLRLTNGASNGRFQLCGNGAADFGLHAGNAHGDTPVSSTPTSSQNAYGLFGVPTKSQLGDLSSGLYADLSSASAVTINSLREAFQVQKWYEQLARGGSRYQELLLSMFGTDAGDARLQRPEYLGGGTIPIQVHSVAQTSASTKDLYTGEPTTPQGNLAAYGVAGGSGIGFSKSFVEHGFVIGFVSVRGDQNFQQGLDRFWSRRTKFDFYWPAFAHLGEVGILNKEIYLQGENNPVDDQIFGYQERWYEYRYGTSLITGKLRSGVTGSLDVWHLAQNFANLPVLNEEFVQENVPVSRVIAVQDEPQFIFDSVIKCRHARVMPTYSVPGLVDHF